jgi:DUF4097 and DUF4098 domain-containing protein YvlB
MAMLVLILIVTGCGVVGPTEEKDANFSVDGTPMLDVRTANGFIEIKTGVDGEVHVHARLRGTDKIDYDVNQDGNTITVNAQIKHGEAGADITITTPAFSDLELNTSNGRVEIDGIQGNVDIHTSNGQVSLQNVKGDFLASTSNGRINLQNVEGDFDASTSNGRISIETMKGTAELHTSNGAINMQNVSGEFDASTSSGSISFSGRLIAGSDNRLTTSNGDVNVEIWAPISIRLDAETSNADVRCEVPILATKTEDDHLIGTIGDGEADLFIHTSNGDVIIRES